MARNILVVEDDNNISNLIKMYLDKEGFDVRIAYDGGKAVEEYDRQAPDMVLLDIMLPDMDGFEVCRRIRKAGNTPVMMLTAKGETFDKVLGLELGADDYMVKPFDAKEWWPHQGGAAPLARPPRCCREHRGRDRIRQPASGHEQL